CVIGSLATKPDDMEVLKKFYVRVRPWGFWGPVLKAAQLQHPELKGSNTLGRDWMNIAVGVVWQTALVAASIFMVIQFWTEFMVAISVVAVTSVFLWKFWWCTLRDYPE